ncbi:MAG TPA: VOC family protein, partial [Albitalea sp.]|nr:VOC family protein [Albitalea sp.]
LTLQAAIEAEDAAARAGRRVTAVDEIWQRKAALLDRRHGRRGARLRIYVPRVQEFAPLVIEAGRRCGCRVVSRDGYDCIEADTPIEFRRQVLGLKPAVWYGLFTGGVHGRIEVLDRDHVVIVPLKA